MQEKERESDDIKMRHIWIPVSATYHKRGTWVEKANISDVDCCATRLRITVEDAGKVNEDILKQSGSRGIVKKGQGVQIIYGPQVTVIKANLEDYLETAMIAGRDRRGD